MSIFEEVKEFFVRNCRVRTTPVPTKDEGVILYDGDGNERLVRMQDKQRQNKFELASVSDFQDFVKDIPLRYPKDLAVYRELTVTVNEQDVPVSVAISIPHDDPRDAMAAFKLKLHEDFERWFDGKQRTQTDFRRMLIELADQHDCGDLALALNFLEYKTEVTFEASAETERNYVLGFKEKEGKGGLNIPKVINVKCPVISGAKYIVEVAFDIIIRKPKQDDPRILFSLSPAGRSIVKIVRDASTVVTENELLMPALDALGANGVVPMRPLYVREKIAPTVFTPSGEIAQL